MKSLVITCSCGSKCESTLRLKDDEEKAGNVILEIGRKGEFYIPFVSLDREQVVDIIKVLKTKYKGM